MAIVNKSTDFPKDKPFKVEDISTSLYLFKGRYVSLSKLIDTHKCTVHKVYTYRSEEPVDEDFYVIGSPKNGYSVATKHRCTGYSPIGQIEFLDDVGSE